MKLSDFFILFLFPLLGLVFEVFPKKVIRWLCVFCISILLPYIFGYQYIIPYIIQIGVLFLISGLYSLGIRNMSSGKFIFSFTIFAFLLVTLGYITWVDAMAGYTQVDKTWQRERYKIDYVRSQGFSGRPLLTYKLNKYAVIPLLYKTIETVVDEDTTNACQVIFPESKFVFDKCKP